MDKNWVWAGIGGGILVALLATSRRKDYAQLKGVSDGDIANMARTLIAETGFTRGRDEMASIVQVAVNRALARQVTLSQVATPDLQPQWNNSATFAALFSAAARNPRLAAAKAFVIEVLENKHPNYIGQRKHFVHPAAKGFDPPCVSTQGTPRVLTRTFAGQRCLPPWALTNPLKVGGAQFSA